ncbi:MAG: ABC transporter substrate-binding protein, partial [Eubacterium sp.]|nr:ABC transporter substrate-binding protein [Eubacterium sp.]
DEPETTTAPPLQQKNFIPTDDTTFKLSYTQSDSLNPYECITQNNQLLAQLVFESLFNLDENYKSSLNLASSYRYTNSKTLEVTIPDGLTFSDGSALTADDITYSFRKAAKSSYWGNSLNGISSCNAASATVIEFHLRYPNSYAQNLLIFPIMSTSNDENGYPVGNGRYYFAKENGETVLKANVSDDFNPHLTAIHLENITSYESIDNAVNIGNISFAFRDLSRDSARKISSNKKMVNMNNLVYIGINNSSGITANSYIRKAISLAVTREALVKSAYSNFAHEATTVFNPDFELSATQIFDTSADTNAAKQAIAQSGISNLSISLLVNNSNADRATCAKLIKQQLEAVGFQVNLVTAGTYEDYEKRITEEQFDLYVGETKVSPDMSLQTFFSSDGSTHYGIKIEECNSAAEYNKYINGETELGAFLLAFSDEMPYIPLLYRKGMICFSKAMNGDMQGTYTNCFANIENWYFKAE